LAEDIVCSFQSKLPIVIVRPAVVGPSIREPFEGFVDGMHSGMGVYCSIATGMLRSMHCSDDSTMSFTPVDYVVNATIVATWNRSLVDSTDDILIYNCANDDDNAILWKDSVGMVEKLACVYTPYKTLFWLPRTSVTSSYFRHKTSMFLFQTVPAAFVDVFGMMLGKKTM